MALTGFISTSMDKSLAETFVWSNKDSGHVKTLFHILWKEKEGYYVMDMSSFPEEKEVLLYDGSTYEVISVDQTKDKKGETMNVVVLKSQFIAS